MGLVTKDHGDLYEYNPSTGNVEYRRIKDSSVNRILNKIRDDYDRTNKGNDASLFDMLLVFDLLYLAIVGAIWVTMGLPNSFNIWITVITGILTSFFIMVRPWLVLTPILNYIILMLVLYYFIPLRVDIHYKDCEEAHYVVKHGHTKSKREQNCIFEMYYEKHAEEFREKYNVQKVNCNRK